MAKKSKTIPLIRKHGAMIASLGQVPAKYRSMLIKHAPNSVIQCIAECCHNVLKGNVPLSESQKRSLHSKREHLRQVASKSVPIPEKRKILNQKGGFLPALIPIIASVLGNIF